MQKVINPKNKKYRDFCPIQIYYLGKVLHANTMGQKR
jgi:hypothetical protein